jgi:hypothetical protein
MLLPAFSINMLLMKRAALLGAVVVLASLLAGCIPQESFYPLFTKDDTFFDKRLLGEWQIWGGTATKEKDKAGQIIFSEGDETYTYEVRLPDPDEGTAIVSVARLAKLDKYVFIDFATPDGSKMTQKPFPAVACHAFGRLTLENDKARIDLLNDDWVKAQVKSGQLGLAFVQTPDIIVLSATTADLRKFATARAEDQAAFSETYTLARKN